MSDFITIKAGTSPLVLSMPHAGTDVPEDVAGALNETGRAVPDTDWWIDRLYDFADEFEPTIVKTSISRYVIDLNRDPAGAPLYPGQATTDLCPTTTFDGEPIYKEGRGPDAAEVKRRLDRYFLPYHAALDRAIEETKARHGYVVLYDCHSIRSVVPRLFPGTLPVMNIGTNGGASCAAAMEAAAIRAAQATPQFDYIANGRFRGGWITRHYGRPEEHVHALQMELAQRAYMKESPPWEYDGGNAEVIRPVLASVLKAMVQAAREIEAENKSQ